MTSIYRIHADKRKDKTLELQPKAKEGLAAVLFTMISEEAQIINYLKATGMGVGLVINFGSTDKLEWKRYIRTEQ